MTLAAAIGILLALCTGLYAAMFLLLRIGVGRVLRASNGQETGRNPGTDSEIPPALAQGELRQTGPPFGRDDDRNVALTGATARIGEGVTIIVAAHNEAANMPSLLEAIARQSYPAHRIRLILADDRSDDGTADSVRTVLGHLQESAASPAGSIRASILRVDSVPDGVSPKKHALHTAIGLAETEFLLFTDADCIPGPRWVESMVTAFGSGADIVVGLSSMTSPSTFTGKLAAYDTVRTALFAFGALGLGHPYMAVGRNWAYRKSAYEACGGLPPLYRHLGGDDDLLFQAMRSKGSSVSAAAAPESMCGTRAPVTFRAFVRQKLRHYRVSLSYDTMVKLLLGTAGALGMLGLFGAPLWLGFAGILHPALCAVLFLAAAGCALWSATPLLRIMIPRDRRRSMILLLPFLEPAHIVFSAVVGSLSFLIRPRW